ncbi:hypothetical protein [Nitrosovibrio sp. Nv6]|uniref:hypothetical protein n=1 Tax=Nitrosovibrio sp. Nv6 TaxID=1855340 RepID=UPI0008CE15AE|nr:hypothetical protein [Nitrosovibrio sp. Nv6]SEO75527.1 hypothetical protein SAMN05216316_1002 [Nitrosovibrio sp. Nv6]
MPDYRSVTARVGQLEFRPQSCQIMSNALRGHEIAALPKPLIPNVPHIMLPRYIGGIPAAALAETESSYPWQKTDQSRRTTHPAKISENPRRRHAVQSAAKDETVCAVIPDKPERKKYILLPTKETREQGTRFVLKFFT